ncbi:hypothetical protein PQR71_18065 [Paraburkholderia fungorum]|uniref:hypothetical protein n=1 Tax=Paraburkholderia fungorum TaxID=134537 RepID=UPI0038B98899
MFNKNSTQNYVGAGRVLSSEYQSFLLVISQGDSMRVCELLALLSCADPEALLLVFPQYPDFSDGAVLRDVIVPESLWTRESGLCSGKPYEFFYPEDPDPVTSPHSNVSTERVAVVLIGEDLGNFRLPPR